MTVYLMITEDRHSDVGVRVFLDKADALNTASNLAREYCHDLADLNETKIVGWLYCGRYSAEGDLIRVVEAETE